MGLYTSWNDADPHHQPSPADLHAWPNTVGGQIMNAPGVAAANVTTVLGMDLLLGAFQHIGWTWDPAVAGRFEASGRQLLDRAAHMAGRGECGWLAAALYVLLKTPPPYGFGQQGAEIRIYSGGASYDPPGQTDDGFVANHVGLHHNLPANVAQYDPVHNPVPLESYYKWGDHAVVEFTVGGLVHYCDPSYNARWRPITQMATSLIASSTPVHPFNMNYQLSGGALHNQWLRHRTGTEANYNPHAIYLLSHPNPAPLPAVQGAQRAVPICCSCNIL